ncbi:MAG TPA: vWA domain-containing protein, partial [Oscillospiraceae bacterium]|nr:vWA domain-containing protein [Oscillospiraceae bacterium]
SITKFNTLGQYVQEEMLSVLNDSERQTLINKIAGITLYWYTNLEDGINMGNNTFSANPDTAKIMVVLTDGETNTYRVDYYPYYYGDPNTQNAKDKAIANAAIAKSAGVTIYTIGFGYTDATLESIASLDDENQPLYFYVNDAIALNTAFTTITNSIDSPALTDSMGNYLTTSSGTVTGPTGITVGASGDLLSWSPTAADLTTGHGNFITYTVTLDITNIAAGEYDNYALNNGASFGVSIDGNSVNGNFPVPLAEFDIGTLDVSFRAGTTTIAPNETQQKIITDWGTPTFTTNTPPATLEYGGQTYYYDNSTYDGSPYTVDGATDTATAGEHALIHNYSLHNRNVSYAYDSTAAGAVTPIGGAPTLPTGGTYAAGTTDISVAGTLSATGYTFHGWATTDVTVSGGTFTMPDNNVEFTGYFTADTVNYTVKYYLQNLTATGYDLQTGDTDTNTGLTGSTGAIDAGYQTKYTGFTYQKAESNLTPNTDFTIQGDGSLIINVYYTRNTHNVSYSYTGTVPSTATALPITAGHLYDTTVTVAANASATGYTFSGWSSSQTTATAGGTFSMPNEDVTFSGSFTPAT